MASSAAEEYLQAIYTLADEGGHVVSARLAEFLGFSAPAVSEMVHRLERGGLVSLDAHKEVHLTKAGKTQADSIVRRHRLAERFLVEVLGFEWWKTHEEAERLEHAMSPEMEERMARVLGDPQTCPHGNPMPGVAARPTRRLEALARGERAAVERIPDQFEHEPGFLEYLDSQGVRPGVVLEVVERGPTLLTVSIDGAVRSLRPDCGQKVWMAA
ncbi:MAG TPA: metal-dependent transcriptional regulator [Chloroflexi bacterium]|jgi:DtxR family Mn-dependent transcriptional regulator|nr:metal-dependent transcriptional regulator [Chloroflexota bacterium]HAL28664.1 metal-dependent transcriptional regulator [Chloroflexota bacterium]